MNKKYLNVFMISAVFLMLFTPLISNQVVNALSTTSTLTVNTQDLNGVAITGIYISLYTNGKQIASGYTPATFIVNNTQMYTVVPNNYLTYIFDHWLDTGSTTSTRNISISSDTTITAVYKTASSAVSTTPRPPTGLTATAISSSQINLSWTAPTDNGGSAITGYKIERSTDAGSTWPTVINIGNTTAYSNTGLVASTAYTYRVSAINSVGTGSPSNTASATTPSTAIVPQPPTGLTATAVSSSQINLSWTAPANNGGSAITGYKIERSADSGSTWSAIVSNTVSTSTTYSNTGLTANVTYPYRVSAINSVGIGNSSNTASATTQPVSTTTSKLTVSTQGLDGAPITSLYAELWKNGAMINGGFTPITFTLNNNQQYTVIADNYLNYVFDHWNDGSTNPNKTITLTQAASLIAYYRK
ncbi:MAG TPA: fibronectin type III domain-containing protein [Nitrosopumilaceae archaeon]|nr:fibronectin type III domain-containing protein [Nitrosopumilaceae archaeon]